MRAVLTYHSLDPSGSPVSVAPEAFRRHVEWLGEAGPPVVPLRDLVADPAGDDALALTFDDAFENFAEVALPALTEAGLPATLFVVTDHVGRDNAWGGVRTPGIPVLPLMDWEALGRAAEAGIELGAHTRTHPHLPGLDPAALTDELEGSAHALRARTGHRPRAFAYPFGAVDDATAAAAARVFDRAVTTELRVLGSTEDPHRIPRLDMYYFRAPGRLEAWGRGGFHRYLALRRGLRAIRRVLSG